MARKRFETPRLRQASNLAYSVSVTERDVTLNSGDAQSLLRHFNFASAALYKMGINLRRLTTKDKVGEIERVVFDEILNPLKNDLAAEVARFERQFGNPKLEAKFTKPFQGTVQFQYPRAKILLDLLVDFDNLLVRVHQLWHAELLDDDEYLRVTDEFRVRLKDSEKRIDQMVRNAIQFAQKEKEDAEVEAGVAALSASAGSQEGSEITPKPTTRKSARKGSEPAGPSPESPGQDQGKVVENSAPENTEGAPFSPFVQ
jgi:hypothetical protein